MKCLELDLNSMIDPSVYLGRIRVCLAIFIVGLVLSGLTAFPLVTEINWLVSGLGVHSGGPAWMPDGMRFWLLHAQEGIVQTNALYPFMAYGTDWLAFGHLMIALFFIAPWRDPVRYIAVIYIGLVCCAMVIPLAFLCGPVRGIPFYWQLIDCSFGVLGSLPLLLAIYWTRQLSR
jgi:hypothetical protein